MQIVAQMKNSHPEKESQPNTLTQILPVLISSPPFAYI